MRQSRLIIIFMSLLFTIALWIAMYQTSVPYTERVFTGVEVKVRGLGEKKVALNDTPLVSIKVRGPEDIVSTMPEPVAWVLVPSDAIGDVVLNVNVDLPPSISLVDINPSSVALRIDVIKKVDVPLKVYNASGLDITYQVEILPPYVTVIGPQTIVDDIDLGKIVLKNNSITEPIIVKTTEIQLIGVTGNIIESNLLEILPLEIQISPLTVEHYFIQVPIVPIIRGYATEEYMLSSIEVDPPYAVILTSTTSLKVDKLYTATVYLQNERIESATITINTSNLNGLGTVIYPASLQVKVRLKWIEMKYYTIKTSVNGVPWLVIVKCPKDVEPSPDIVDNKGNINFDKLPATCIVVYSGTY